MLTAGGALFVGLVGAMVTAGFQRVNQPAPPEHRPLEVLTETYVSSRTCKKCHPGQYDSWYGTYHRTMTQVARPDTVIAPMEGDVEAMGTTYRLSQRPDGFWVEILGAPPGQGAKSPSGPRRIELLTGSHHMQLYWLASEGGDRSLDLLPISYLREEQRWVPRRACFLRPHNSAGYDVVDGPNWNEICAFCHTTAPRPRVAPGGDGKERYDTHVGEFGIACEACHGPAEGHVAANASPVRRYQQHLGDNDDGTIVNPSKLSPKQSSQVCGRCHSILMQGDWADWQAHGIDGVRYRPGDPLEQAFEVKPVDRSIEGFTWSDGMVRVSGREYTAMLGTPCFQQGPMSCQSCHSMHKQADDPRSMKEWANDQLKVGMDTNQACTQCHETHADKLEEHTHHPPASSGSQCYNCHMPYTTYGLLKTSRQHRLDSPTVTTSVQLGRPNACNMCHLDKSLGWTAGHLHTWYDIQAPDLDENQRRIAASVQWALSGDAGQRALMASAMGWGDAWKAAGADWLPPYLAELIVDPYDAVRVMAYRSLRKLRGFETLTYDWLGPYKDRANTKRHVLETWLKRPDSEQKPKATVLLDANGVLDDKEFRRLVQGRDRRSITLAE